MRPLVDRLGYYVECAGVRSARMTRKRAETYAATIVAEWLALGIRRSARVFYRDGSLVTVANSDGSMR